jgi:hypothetical protein
MRHEHLRPVVYRGELVALAGRHRFHLVAPRLADLSDDDPELRFIELLCHYHRQILRGTLPDSGGPNTAEYWARQVTSRARPSPR